MSTAHDHVNHQTYARYTQLRCHLSRPAYSAGVRSPKLHRSPTKLGSPVTRRVLSVINSTHWFDHEPLQLNQSKSPAAVRIAAQHHTSAQRVDSAPLLEEIRSWSAFQGNHTHIHDASTAWQRRHRSPRHSMRVLRLLHLAQGDACCQARHHSAHPRPRCLDQLHKASLKAGQLPGSLPR